MIESLREQKEQKEREERTRLEELEQMRKENQDLRDQMASVLAQKQPGNLGQNQNQSQRPSREVSGTWTLLDWSNSWSLSELRPLLVTL